MGFGEWLRGKLGGAPELRETNELVIDKLDRQRARAGRRLVRADAGVEGRVPAGSGHLPGPAGDPIRVLSVPQRPRRAAPRRRGFRGPTASTSSTASPHDADRCVLSMASRSASSCTGVRMTARSSFRVSIETDASGGRAAPRTAGSAARCRREAGPGLGDLRADAYARTRARACTAAGRLDGLGRVMCRLRLRRSREPVLRDPTAGDPLRSHGGWSSPIADFAPLLQRFLHCRRD